MSSNEILRRELLSFLSSYPKELKTQGHGFAGKLGVQLGNALLALSFSLERGEPQVLQSLDESPQSLYALGKQFREVGLTLWDVPKLQSAQAPDLVERLQRAFGEVNMRLAALEALILKSRKGGKR